MAVGMALLRIKQRLIFAYLLHRYEAPETSSALRADLSAWPDLILATNK